MSGTTDVVEGSAAGEHEHRSRWPVIAAVGAAGLYAGIGLLFVGLDLVPVFVPAGLAGAGVLAFVVGLGGWTYEAFVADYWDDHGRDRAPIYRWGMILFLVSDVATFLAGFVYYAFVRTGAWPPSELPELFGSLVIVNTLVLVASSGTLHYAHGALERDDRQRFLGALGVTVLLGFVFLVGQGVEYYELLVGEGFTITDGVLASAFYGLTGLHGLHVALGAVMLTLTFGRALRGHYTAERDTAITTVSLYWHFVDVVWIMLVVVLYVGADLG